MRRARTEDAATIWRIARDSKVLDLNSPYCYMVLCRDFSATCFVAEVARKVVGFVIAYRVPTNPATLFVWQIGVDKAHRGHGIGGQLLMSLVKKNARLSGTWLETTITTSNRASMALFEGLAQRMCAEMVEIPGFGAELFPNPGHEPEPRYRIGPLTVPESE
ncbi:MAG: diaminobutyrate acetyltransferase [Leptospirillia bacterium]